MTRGNPYKHKYKNGKQTKVLTYQFFKISLETGHKVDSLRDEALIILLYYLGCRIQALLRLRKEDLEIHNDTLYIKLQPLKRGIRHIPLKLPLDLPLMNRVMKYINDIESDKIFPFSYSTAWRIVKRIFPKRYPHFFRLNRCTNFLNDPKSTIPELKAWFGWKTTKAVDSYIGYSDRYLDKGIERLKKEVS